MRFYVTCARLSRSVKRLLAFLKLIADKYISLFLDIVMTFCDANLSATAKLKAKMLTHSMKCFCASWNLDFQLSYIKCSHEVYFGNLADVIKPGKFKFDTDR